MKKIKEKEFIPVMLTLFTESGDVDYDGVARLTEYYIRAGAKGLFANCQSSEMYMLSDEEKLAVVNLVMKVADARVPVVAVGNFGDSIEEQAEFIQRIYATGVKAVIIVTSLVAEEHESAEIFDERIFKLFELTGDTPLGFYECPEPYKRVLSAGQLQKFVATGRVIYHKDTCLDIHMIRQKLEVTKAYADFGLYDAYVVNAVDSLEAGAAGLSCIQGNFFPELMVWLCDHYDDPALKTEVVKVQDFLSQNMEVAHHAYPAVAKYFLQKCGLDNSTFTRTKTGSLSKDVQVNIDNFFDEYSRLKQDIGIITPQLSESFQGIKNSIEK